MRMRRSPSDVVYSSADWMAIVSAVIAPSSCCSSRAKLESASRQTVDTFRNRDDIMSGQIAWVRVEGMA